MSTYCAHGRHRATELCWICAMDSLKSTAVAPKSSKANDQQHGGTHYKDCAIQPWDYIAANHIGYFEGCAIKYLTRWKAKGGVEDLRKARHFIEKLIELETAQNKNED